MKYLINAQNGRSRFYQLLTILFLFQVLTETALSSTDVEQKWSFVPESGYWINSIDMAPDGKNIIAGTYLPNKNGNFGVYYLDKAGIPIWKDVFVDSFSGVYSVALSKKGDYAAAGGWWKEEKIGVDPKRIGFLRAYQTRPFKLLLHADTSTRVNTVLFCNNASYIIAVTGYTEGEILIYKHGDESYFLSDSVTSATKGIATASVSTDCKFILIGSIGGNVSLYTLDEKGSLVSLKSWQLSRIHTKGIRRVYLTSNGKNFGVAASDGYFYFFDTSSFISSGEPLWEMRAKGNTEVYGIIISENSRYIAAISNSDNIDNSIGYVQFVENSDGQPVIKWIYETKRFPNPGLSMDKNARFLAVPDGYPVGTPGHFYLLDTASGKAIWTYETENMNWPMVISEDGRVVAAGSDDSGIYYFNIVQSDVN